MIDLDGIKRKKGHEREKVKIDQGNKSPNKAEFRKEGIFFLLQLFARDVLVMKKLEIKKTKPAFKNF